MKTAQLSLHERFVRLGTFVVDLSSGEVQKDGKRLRLPNQPTQLLLALLERQGEIVSREDLRAKLWPDDTNVAFDHSIGAAVNKLRQALGDSSKHPQFIETIPRRGYRLVPPTSLGRQTVSSPEWCFEKGPGCLRTTSRTNRWRVRGSHTALLVSAALLLTITSLVAVRLQSQSKSKSQTTSSSPSVSPASLPRRVAVVGFKDLSSRPDSAWLSTAFSEMLFTELGTSAGLQPVSGEEVAQMKRELSLGDADPYTQETLKRIRRNLGAELVIAGSFARIGNDNAQDSIRFDIHLQNTSTGETVASLSETGTMAQLFGLISDAGLRLREQLGVQSLSRTEETAIKHSIPSNSMAQTLYFSGLERLRQLDYVDARAVLMQAAAADPKDALIHEALSAAYAAGGYDSQAAKEAELAFELSKGLTCEQGLQVEGRYYETKHEWTRAAEIYQRLHRFSPQVIDYVIHLADVQGLDGKPQEAIALVHQLGASARSVRDGARLDLAEALAEQRSGDFRKELAAAKAAAARGEQAGAPLVVARALRMQGVAFSYLGDNAQALQNIREAQKVFQTLKDEAGSVDTLTDEGDILSDRGDMSGAELAWTRALALARATGSKRKEATISNNLGNILLTRGDPRKARIMYEQSYQIACEIHDKTGQVNSLLTIGDSLADEGRLSPARKYYEQSLQLSTEIANQEVMAAALQGLGGVLLDLGDLAGARQTLEESVAAAQASGDKPTEVAALTVLGQVEAAQGSLLGAQSTELKALTEADTLGDKSIQAAICRSLGQISSMQGDLVKARARYEQAVALELNIQAHAQETETRYFMAELDIEERRLSEAKEELRYLQDEVRRTNNVDTELQRLILQAELDLLNNQLEESLKAASRAQALSSKNERFGLQMSAAEVLTRAAGASQRWKQGDQIISAALQQASRAGCVACELKAQLSQCALRAEEDVSDGSLCAEDLRRKAEAGGFGLIARKAAGRPGIAK